MPWLRRFLVLTVACAALLTVNILYTQHKQQWPRHKSHNAGVSHSHSHNGWPAAGTGSDIRPDVEAEEGISADQYTRTIVMSRMSADDVSWIDESLGDLLHPAGPFNKSIYIADDRKAGLRVKKNKGHEVMTYLTYIADNYDTLADVTIFIHADRWAWHNNPLLDDDMAAMLRYLKPEKVIEEGYYNLRCQWDPGCPHWLQLETQENSKGVQRKEEKALAEHWRELFPLDDRPATLSQPCCSQFAVSRERLRAIPKQRYITLRTWVMRTPLDDSRTGRMFEYLWQYMFTGKPEVCPAMYECYCEAYGVCFEDDRQFDKWYEMRQTKQKHDEQIEQWKAYLDGETEKGGSASSDNDEGLGSTVRLAEARIASERLGKQMKQLRDEAFLRGHPEKARR